VSWYETDHTAFGLMEGFIDKLDHYKNRKICKNVRVDEK
jgi:hypothetical protein